MKRRIVLSLIAVAIALGATAGSALAQHAVKATLNVPAGLNPNDLHIQFNGTGGTITGPTVDPPQGGGGSIGVSGGGNTVDVVWDAKLAPGTPVTLRFNCQHNVVGIVGGTWTNDGNVIGNITNADVTVVNDPLDPVPGASPLTMALVALLIAGTGVMMLRRRAIA